MPLLSADELHKDSRGPEFASEILHDIGVNPIVTHTGPGIESIMRGIIH